ARTGRTEAPACDNGGVLAGSDGAARSVLSRAAPLCRILPGFILADERKPLIPQFFRPVTRIATVMKRAAPAFRRPVLASTILLVAAGWLPGQALLAQDFGAAHATDLLTQYCSDCHNSEDWAGSVAFDLLDVDSVDRETDTWEKALRKLRGRL